MCGSSNPFAFFLPPSHHRLSLPLPVPLVSTLDPSLLLPFLITSWRLPTGMQIRRSKNVAPKRRRSSLLLAKHVASKQRGNNLGRGRWRNDFTVGPVQLFLHEQSLAMSSSSKQSEVITCRAAVAWGAGEALVIEEVEVSPPQPLEIRIKVVCTSLCRSDLSAWESQPLFPRIFGHEAAGIVESVGEGVTEFEKGDRVLTVFTGECRACRHCVSGKSNMCQVLGMERKGVMHSDQKTRFSIKGKPVYHYCAVSSFSEYTVVHSGCAVKVDPKAPLEKICLLSCGAAAGLGAAWNVANVLNSSTVAIFGLGTVGLSIAQGAKLRGAAKIIGVDINPAKADKAKIFGVTDFINPDDYNEPIQQVIKRMTGGGADYSFECIGDTGMITTALQSCSDGWGVTVTLGVPKMKPEIVAHYGLFLSGRTLRGSLFGGWKPKSDLPSLVDKYMNKEIIIDELVTHNLAFDDINKGFELMRDGKCLRCVFHMPN